MQTIVPSTILTSQSLSFSGGEIDFGGLGNPVVTGVGNLAINNYGQSATTSFNATGSIVGQGTTQLAVNGGDVILQAAQVTAAPLSQTGLSAATVAAEPASATQTQAAAQASLTIVQTVETVGSAATFGVTAGNLQVLPNGAAAPATAMSASLGGGLSLSGKNVTDSGSIIVPGGRISLQATSGDLDVNSGAVLDTSGISVTVANQTRGASGGIVNLTAMGNLLLAQGSTIGVAGASGSPDGAVNLVAQTGNAKVGATLNGGNPNDTMGASFSLYTGSQLTGGLPSLASVLGAFTSAINVEVGTGDLDLAAGSSLIANQVNLTADSGAIDIAGTINAPSASLRGSIGLFALNDVTLESTGTLTANATTQNNDSSGRGGDIELSTLVGAINLPSSATSAQGIFASGPAGAGSLLLRAPTVNGNDVSISSISANLGVGHLTIEPVLQAADYSADYQAGYVPTGDITSAANVDAIATTVQTYYANAANTIATRLQVGSATDIPLVIEPGVVVNETATTTLSSALNLYDAIGTGSSNGVAIPIDLTVRSTGSLTIKGNITDGVDDDGSLLGGPSSSLRFVAGANLASANPLGIVPGQAATLTLGNATATTGRGAILETGTGDIDLVSSGQITINPFSSAFTTGTLPDTSVDSPTLTFAGVGTISYMNNGGNVMVDAGTNIVANNAQGNISAWLTYSSKTLTDGAQVGVWGANLTAFNANPWSVATLGGGDVQVTAGGNITTMSIAAAGSMNAGPSAQTPSSSGGLAVSAGGNIAGDQFFLADGAGNINAGETFSTVPLTSSSGALPLQTGSLFALQNSRLSLWAEDGITISAVVNPTMLTQPKAVGQLGGLNFSSYGDDSALNAQTSSGSVVMNDTSSSYNVFSGRAGVTPGSTTAYSILPTSLDLASLSQDVNLGSTIATLFPSATGQFTLFAARDILGAPSGALDVISMSDAPVGTVATAANVSGAPVSVLTGLSAYNFSGDLHAGSDAAASIVAGTGYQQSGTVPARGRANHSGTRHRESGLPGSESRGH